MGSRYDRVKHFEDSLHIHAYGYFNEQIRVFDEMMEFYLEPLDEIGGRGSRVAKSAVVVLLARMFNDFECSKRLLLCGQPEQACMPVRDVVECMMLVRLFGCDPERALRWMKNLKEYQPADVKKRLDELGVDCPEHSLYAMLSQLCHPNLLSVASRVTEKKVGKDLFLVTHHFGGIDRPSWIRLVFNSMLLVQWMALVSVAAPVYFPYMSSPEEWWNRLAGVRDRLKGIVGDAMEFEEVEESAEDRVGRQKVYKKIGLMRIHATFFDKEEVASDEGFPGLSY